MATVEVKRLFMTCGPQDVLKGIDLRCADGEFLVLVGPSGCGKSTLLNAIAGLDQPTSGEIFIGEREVTGTPPKDRDIAMVFQSYALYPTMTVRENIGFGLEMRGVPKAERERKIARAAQMLQIESMLDRKPGQLSGGQRQRVAMGRAIVRNPAVFLFDEPLSNLDAQLRVEMRTEIKRLHQRLKTTTVYVTHDQIEAMTMATLIAVMKDGIIQQLGEPQTLYDSPKNMFVAGFIGSPAMNFVPARLESSGGGVAARVTREGAEPLAVPLDGRPLAGLRGLVGRDVVLGLRPEHVTEQSAHSGEEGYFSFDCPVEVFEPTGPDTLAVLRLGGKEVSARVRPDARLKAGETMRFALRRDKILLFDPKTEGRL